MSDARLEIRAPQRFNFRAIVAITLYGLLVSLPVICAMLVVSLRQFSLWTFLLPLLAVTLASFFLPFGFGNTLVVRLVRSLRSAPAPTADAFIVQLTLSPRLRSGWRALLEDADDVGWLELSDVALKFQGDSISFSLPYSRVTRFRRQSSGWRGLFAYGSRVLLETDGLSNFCAVQFAERSSSILPASRRNARAIHVALARKLQSAGANTTKPQP